MSATEDLRVLAKEYLLAYEGVEGGISRLAHTVLTLLSEREAAERERDELWCRALIATLTTDEIERVTAEFNHIRPDASQLTEAQMAEVRLCWGGEKP